MSGDGLTWVIVTETPARSGSRSSPRRSTCESAWRNISPTRSWRWLGPLLAERSLCRDTAIKPTLERDQRKNIGGPVSQRQSLPRGWRSFAWEEHVRRHDRQIYRCVAWFPRSYARRSNWFGLHLFCCSNARRLARARYRLVSEMIHWDRELTCYWRTAQTGNR